jgi:hypothetical protein
MTNIDVADSAAPLPAQGNELPALVKKIGETRSDKIKRMLRNELQQMKP